MTKKNTGKKTAGSQKKPEKKQRGSGRQGKKSPSKKAKESRKGGFFFINAVINMALLVIIVVVTVVIVLYVFPPNGVDDNLPLKTEYVEEPDFEVYPPEETEATHVVTMPMPPRPKKRPNVAIIIDDIGYDRKIANKFADLDPVITFSLLPNSPHYRQIAKNAHQKGVEIMLHLPMEPTDYPKANPGADALLVSMPADEMIGLLNKHIESVPHIVGVNNHMGSKMTTISTKMYQIFTILKKRDLFFIDSRTSPQSLCKPSARLLQIPFAERDVFLDHNQTQEAVRKQLQSLVKIALKTGSAIGIGHPYKVTYEVLREEWPDLNKQVRLVRASELVRPLG